MNPKQLPIYELASALSAALRSENRVIIEAPTGSGKSTQVPQMILDRGGVGPGEIVVLQPRRLAARLLAKRVAEERHVLVGDEVGYQIRMEQCISAKTQIRYVTEGILLRQFLSDPQLRGVSTIIFDEFHERHIYGDITLARAMLLQQTRPELRIVVMSATLDAGPLMDYLTPCRTLKSEGRAYPVNIEFSPKRIDFRRIPVWEAAANAFEKVVEQGTEGDVLVFMPGGYEISKTVEAIRYKKSARGFAVMPLHGGSSAREQDAAVGACSQRKVVVATNVAETSITIDGIRVVIDSGLARIGRYDPHRGIETLLVERISRSSADQRSGRAGRTGPGRSVRLWTEKEHMSRPMQELPEILRHDLAEVVLTLKAGGIENVGKFPWFESPDLKSLQKTITLLSDLGALDRNGELTDIGAKMVSFPVHPRYARMLLAGDQYGCVREACLIAALTQGRSILQHKNDKKILHRLDALLGDSNVSDFKRLMNAWFFADQNRYHVATCREYGIHAGAARQVKPLYDRFLQIARKENLTINKEAPCDEDLQKAILLAFSDHVAKRRDQGSLRCVVIHERSGDLDKNSVVRDSELLVASEITEIEGRDLNVRLNLCTSINENWLEELFPEDIKQLNQAIFDPRLKRVVTKKANLFRDLELSSRMVQEVDSQQAAEIMAEEVFAGRLLLYKWDDQVEKWIARVNCLAQNCPDLGVSVIDDEARRMMIQEICLGAVCKRDLKDRSVRPVVHSWLIDVQHEMLKKQVPERIQLPSGYHAKVRYELGQSPVIAATIQKLYDLTETPKICFGRIPVLIEVLAPNQRPQQVTKDMKSFWRSTYPLLKKELQGRYPKHEWR